MNDLHLLVALGDDRYALAVTEVCEVLRPGVLTPVPGAPRMVLGVLNLRGEILPVLDAAAMLGSPPLERPGSVVVIESGELRAGLAVCAVIDVLPLPLGLEPSDDDRLAGSALLDGALVGVLDVRTLLEGVGAGAPG